MDTKDDDESFESYGNGARIELLERRVLSKISALDRKVDAQFRILQELIRSQGEHKGPWQSASNNQQEPHHHHHHHSLSEQAGTTSDPFTDTDSLSGVVVEKKKGISFSPFRSTDEPSAEDASLTAISDTSVEKTSASSRGILVVDDGSESEASSGDDSSRGSEASSMASSFREPGFQTNDDEEKEEDGKLPTVKVESDEGMINPKNVFRNTWDLCVLLPFLIYLTLTLPFRLCFVNDPIPFSAIYWFEFTIDFVFIIDIILNFFTGYVLVGELHSEDVNSIALIEYDRKRVACHYSRSWFILDVVSGVPFLFIELLLNSSTGGGFLKSIKTLKLLRFLKLGRLFKLDKIFSSLKRETLDIIEDFLHNQKTQFIATMVLLLILMSFSCHLMACGWVVIGRLGVISGERSWFNNDIYGPFVAKDTTGGDWVATIYLSAFYFCLTTMTSVGYGDLSTKNNIERLYVLALEFSGAIIFASVIAVITALVTAEDANARNKKEQLEMVMSFCETRQFSVKLGRRIRRHFRKFYEKKSMSAINEVKIFSELSIPLRKEVSAYLIESLMGTDSFFGKMSPHLWPFLIPMLRPMCFDAKEVVCVQKEDAIDMYTVLSGVLTCSNSVEGESDSPRVRHAITGHTVNLLYALGVWSKCIETATSEVQTETYAISKEDFRGLYTSETDMEAFVAMRRQEVRNYHMEQSGSNTTFDLGQTFDLGRPVCFTCFSSLALTINCAHIPDLLSIQEARDGKVSSPSSRRLSNLSFDNLSVFTTMDTKSSGPYLGEAWAIVDLICATTGKTLNDSWRYKTEKAQITFVSKEDNNTGLADWSKVVRWDDINVQFDDIAIRVRVYVDGAAAHGSTKNKKGAPLTSNEVQNGRLVGRSLVALADWDSKQKEVTVARKVEGRKGRKSSLSKPTELSYGRAQINDQLEEWASMEEPSIGQNKNRNLSFSSKGSHSSIRSKSLSHAPAFFLGKSEAETGKTGAKWSAMRAAVLHATPEEKNSEPRDFGKVNLLICARRPWRQRKVRHTTKAAKSDSFFAKDKKTDVSLPKIGEGLFPINESRFQSGSESRSHHEAIGLELAKLPERSARRISGVSFIDSLEVSIDAPKKAASEGSGHPLDCRIDEE